MENLAIKLKALFVLCLVMVGAVGSVQAVIWGESSEVPSSAPMVHDPVMIKQGDTYYLFCTGRGVTVMSSKDLKEWKRRVLCSVKYRNGQWKWFPVLGGISGHPILSFIKVNIIVLFLLRFRKEYFCHRACYDSYLRLV